MVRRVSNPPNPWASTWVEYLGEPPAAELEVFEEEARSILAENDSPDVGFRFSVNPYRGCFHACGYCYARPTHQYLGFGAGTDFDRKIVVKRNAPERLRRELARPGWRGDPIVFSGVTDCYQPLEAVYGLTRRCLEVCRRFGNPVGVVTKGALIRRDLGLLAAMARETEVTVYLSVPFLDDRIARLLEPNASVPSQRFARKAFLTLLRLPAQTLPVFEERLAEALPARAAKIWSTLEAARRGRRHDGRSCARMRGEGPRWEVIETLFDVTCRRLDMNRGEEKAQRRGTAPRRRAQRGLFEESLGSSDPAK